MGMPEAGLSDTDWARLRGWASDRLERGTQRHFWPDLLRVEKRYFANNYAAGTTYNNDGEFVYYRPTKKYYTCLAAGTIGVAPADSAGDTVLTSWAVVATAYSADEYVAADAYAVGDRVYYALEDAFYQAHQATTGNLPTVTGSWGKLYEFDRVIAWAQSWEANELGDVFEVYDKHPERDRSAEALSLSSDWVQNQTGVLVRRDLPFVYIRYRKTPILLTGDTFDAAATYAVGDQIYYTSATVLGDFYNCIVATTAGQDPDDTAASWELVEILQRFNRYMKQGMYADYLTDGQNEKAYGEERMAESYLDESVTVLVTQEQQRPQTQIRTR